VVVIDAARLILEVRLGSRRGTKVALRAGETICVGRAAPADVLIPDDTRLSGRHFTVGWDGVKATLTDLHPERGATLLNGEPKQGELRHGAWIRAGDTDFTVHVEAHTPPPKEDDGPFEDDDEEPTAAPPPFAEEPPKPTGSADEAEQEKAFAAERRRVRVSQMVERRMARRVRKLREQAADRALPILQATAAAGALHVVLDAARTPRILQVLREAVEEHRSLYEGIKGQALDDVAPYLVAVQADSRLLAQLVREGWGLRWGIFLEGAVSERELRRHLRRFLMVENDRGEPLYFRYYDPGALRVLWPSWARRQLAELMGPLQAYLVEGERGEVLRLTPAGDIEVPLGPVDLTGNVNVNGPG